MANITQKDQHALAFHFIDVITSASPKEVVDVLTANGYADQFKYGVNGQQAIITLQQLYVSNPTKFIELVGKMNIDYTRIPPNERQAYQEMVSQTNPNAKSEWIAGVLEMLTPKTTTGGGEITTEETTTGAYVAYVFIVLAIIGITVYIIKTIK